MFFWTLSEFWAELAIALEFFQIQPILYLFLLVLHLGQPRKVAPFCSLLPSFPGLVEPAMGGLALIMSVLVSWSFFHGLGQLS